jgi:hypothetical protein
MLLEKYMDILDIIIKVNYQFPMLLKQVVGEEKLKEFLDDKK